MQTQVLIESVYLRRLYWVGYVRDAYGKPLKSVYAYSNIRLLFDF